MTNRHALIRDGSNLPYIGTPGASAYFAACHGRPRVTRSFDRGKRRSTAVYAWCKRFQTTVAERGSFEKKGIITSERHEGR